MFMVDSVSTVGYNLCMIDVQAFLGKRFGSWTVLSRATDDSKSNHRWLCRCVCGKERVVLGYNLKKGGSCGCTKTKHPLFIDMTGKRCGKWTVQSQAESRIGRPALWNCVCECGTERIVSGADLRNGASTGCGLCGENKNKLIDLTGKKIGRWLIKDRSQIKINGEARWICKCECGTIKHVLAHNLLNGDSTSCGCYAKEVVINRSTTHGHSPRNNFSPTYQSWSTMMTRCYNPSATKYKNYGGRGISVCDRWHKFENFLEDMGQRPDERSLDRINNDGNYEPGNCRWATAKEQANNRRPRSC